MNESTEMQKGGKEVMSGKNEKCGRGPKFMERVLATIKSAETEGPYELYMARTPGYLWALLFRRLRMRPTTVTLISIVIGAASGWFLGSGELKLNLVGMALLVWANWLDCADGQLARMTGRKTLLGRLLDGFGGDVWFFSIYFFICLHLQPVWGVWGWLLAAWAGFHCHSRQCALADYYRNIHLLFLCGEKGSELDSADRQLALMRSLKWDRRDWFHKLYLFFYVRYTRGQERMTPAFQRLRATLERRGGDVPPEAVRRFLDASRPLMKYCNILTFDTRVGVLFLSVLAGVPWVYFVFECTALEALRWYVRREHERACRTFRLDLRDDG